MRCSRFRTLQTHHPLKAAPTCHLPAAPQPSAKRVRGREKPTLGADSFAWGVNESAPNVFLGTSHALPCTGTALLARCTAILRKTRRISQHTAGRTGHTAASPSGAGYPRTRQCAGLFAPSDKRLYLLDGTKDSYVPSSKNTRISLIFRAGLSISFAYILVRGSFRREWTLSRLAERGVACR